VERDLGYNPRDIHQVKLCNVIIYSIKHSHVNAFTLSNNLLDFMQVPITPVIGISVEYTCCKVSFADDSRGDCSHRNVYKTSQSMKNMPNWMTTTARGTRIRYGPVAAWRISITWAPLVRLAMDISTLLPAPSPFPSLPHVTAVSWPKSLGVSVLIFLGNFQNVA
jgi:hypothetical protein